MHYKEPEERNQNTLMNAFGKGMLLLLFFLTDQQRIDFKSSLALDCAILDLIVLVFAGCKLLSPVDGTPLINITRETALSLQQQLNISAYNLFNRIITTNTKDMQIPHFIDAPDLTNEREICIVAIDEIQVIYALKLVTMMKLNHITFFFCRS